MVHRLALRFLPPQSRSRSDKRPVARRGSSVDKSEVYADKDVQERIIRRSRLDWTIVRPTILTNGPPTDTYRVLVEPNDWTSGFISRADVADFLVKQVDDRSLFHRTPALTG